MTTNKKCRLCEKDIELNYSDGKNNQLEVLEICYECDFWLEKFDSSKAIRIDNNHYLIGPENEKPKGHGGQQFFIKLDNGEEIKTTNLWHQGEIPERFRRYLLNNAIFKNI